MDSEHVNANDLEAIKAPNFIVIDRPKPVSDPHVSGLGRNIHWRASPRTPRSITSYHTEGILREEGT